MKKMWKYISKKDLIFGLVIFMLVILISFKPSNKVRFYFEEDSGHLDYENIYAKTINGEIIKPISYDESSLSVTFKYPKEALNLFIPDMSANTLQVAVTLK